MKRLKNITPSCPTGLVIISACCRLLINLVFPLIFWLGSPLESVRAIAHRLHGRSQSQLWGSQWSAECRDLLKLLKTTVFWCHGETKVPLKTLFSCIRLNEVKGSFVNVFPSFPKGPVSLPCFLLYQNKTNTGWGVVLWALGRCPRTYPHSLWPRDSLL